MPSIKFSISPFIKNSQASGIMGFQTQTASVRHRPATETFILFDESSSPITEDYLIDFVRSTLRLSTSYPIETYL